MISERLDVRICRRQGRAARLRRRRTSHVVNLSTGTISRRELGQPGEATASPSRRATWAFAWPPLGATVWCTPGPGVMPGRHTGADNDLGSSDLEVLHVSESGSALAV